MGSLFAEIRQTVTARQAAEFYGVTVNRYGKALCPFHSDHRPSLSFDPRTGRFRCFACGEGGGAVDLVAALLGVTPLEAAQTIDIDFGLKIEDAESRRPTGDDIARVEAKRCERERRQAQRVNLMKAFNEACDEIHAARAIVDRFTPETAEASPEFDKAMRRLCKAETRADYLLELLNRGDIDGY